MNKTVPDHEEKPEKVTPVERLDYGASWRQVWEGEGWFANLAILGLVAMIPVVGIIVALGYLTDSVEAMHRGRRKTFPTLDLGRFVEYLGRGVWPWLTMFLVQIIMQPIMMILIVPFMIILALAGGVGAEQPGLGGVIFVALIVFMFLVSMGLSVIMMMVMTPAIIRVGLSQDMSKLFEMAWMRDFFKRMRGDLFKAAMFGMCNQFVMSLGILATCGLGVFFFLPASLISQQNFQFQLYELYLRRGGEPITLKEPTPTAEAAWSGVANG